MIVVGLMSGTSMDGLDVAVADITREDSALVLRPLGATTVDWDPGLRERMLAVLPPAATTVEQICRLDTEIGQAGARAARDAVERIAGGRADLVGSHGQTVFHWVDGGQARGTLQLGQPAWIVEATGLPVVSDLRARDVAAGGQGAPLASTLDALWLAADHPRAALNLGGIANVTVVGAPGRPVVAFDTGPANCLLDVAVARRTGGRFDDDGVLAASGRPDTALLQDLLADPYYRAPAPKSTGREYFDGDYVERRLAGRPIATGDLLATLIELTAVTVADALRPHGVREVVASGGGVRNPALLGALRRRLAPVELVTSDERGLPHEAKEAYLVALLAYLSWHQIPGTVAGATGSAHPRVLGRITLGDRPVALPLPATAPTRLDIRPVRSTDA